MRSFLWVLIWGSASALAGGEIWWNEDGKALDTSAQYSQAAWFANGSPPRIEARKEGGFMLGSNCSKYLTNVSLSGSGCRRCQHRS